MSGLDRLDLRILIGAGSFSDAAAALQIVEGLPRPLFSGLGGLFIEEPDVFTTCQMPHQQIVSPSGIRTLAPKVSDIKLLLRADARAFERAVLRAAQTVGAGCAFAEEQGDLIATSLRAAKGWDVLLIGYRRVHPKRGKVVVIKNARPLDETIDTVSSSLSHTFSTERIILSVAPQRETAKAAQSISSRQFDSVGDCARALARINCLVVLLDLAQGPVSNTPDFSRILDAARCPVMAFGAQKRASTDEISSTAQSDLSGLRKS